MHMLAEYILFLAKSITIVVSILIILGSIISLSGKKKQKGKMTVKKLNDQYHAIEKELANKTLDKKALKASLKKDKKTQKNRAKDSHSRLFVIHFNGDIQAHAVESLRQEVTAVLLSATDQDEVLVCVESPGGVVPSYGLASSQLARIREANIKLTIAVDKVAASGGYMMACVANHIIAAPFAIVGSIGVVAQLPNFHRFLDKKSIDFEQITAGEYKRTLTYFGENTDSGREKMQADINEAHELFKQHIAHFRPQLNINDVATGEYWYGTQALSLGLIDNIQTSDDYLLQHKNQYDLIEVGYAMKKPFPQSLMQQANKLYHRLSKESIMFKSQHSHGLE